jgi:adenosylcobyric acid synthase
MLQAQAFNTPTLGVIPFLPEIGVAEEDSVALEEAKRSGGAGEPGSRGGEVKIIDIAVIRLPCISNFDDFDPLAAEPGVRVRFIERAGDLGQPAAVILPGSKMTLADLAWLRQTGLADQVVVLAEMGTPVVGICGGYQMLGRSLSDPDGVEAEAGTEAAGLGLLPVETVFAGDKRTVQVQATLQAKSGPFAALQGTPLGGYEIHMGRSYYLDPDPASLCHVGPLGQGHADGALAANGHIWGTYLHGLFDNDALRQAWLGSLGRQGNNQPFDRQLAYNRLAAHVHAHLDMTALRRIIWGNIEERMKDEG